MSTLSSICFIFGWLRCIAGDAVVISTWSAEGFQQATTKAWNTLLNTDDRVRSLVEGLSECEQLQCDGTVGFGGSPDEEGETRLDALIFNGPGHKMGAVSSMGNVKHAARVALAVMKYTKHSILTGDAATRFAIEMGFKKEPLSTNASLSLHKNWKTKNCQPNFRRNVLPDPRKSCGPYYPADEDSLGNCEHFKTQLYDAGKFHHDTIGMVVVDKNGDIACGTSTNGAIYKIPGRVSDSSIPGAGAFVDNDVGAGVATGDGDVMMRFLPSYQAVESMRQGIRPQKAAEIAILRIEKFYPLFSGAVVAVNKEGNHGAACHGMQTFSYSVRNAQFEGVKIFTVKCL